MRVYLVAAGWFCASLEPACRSRRLDPEAAAGLAVASALGDDFRSVARDQVPLYESGPGQMRPPEATLEKGAPVRVIRRQFGYSLVQTANGTSGWVASEDLTRDGN